MKVSKPQERLLIEICDECLEDGGLYIDGYGRYGRTAKSLVDRGLADSEYVHKTWSLLTPTPAGREMAARIQLRES